jgi:hypothetical protein
MANDMIRTHEPGADVPAQATAAVVGKRFVKISGARSYKFNQLANSADGNNYKVATCGAGQPAFGVAKYDQPTVNGKVGVARSGIVVVTVGATPLVAGTRVMSDANGAAVPWTSAASEANVALGYAVDDAAAGTDAEIALNLG